MNTRKILKGLGLVGLGAGVGYGLYQAYKHYKADEAKAIKHAEEYIADQEQKMKEADPVGDHKEDIVKSNNGTESEQAWIEYMEEGKIEKQVAQARPVMSNKVYNLTSGVDTLRYDANSEEAYDQYAAMIMSDYEIDPDIHETLKKLFNYTIGGYNRRDGIIKDSRFIMDFTMAEMVIFYADKLSDDIGMDIVDAMRIILDAIELTPDRPKDVYEATVSDLTTHNYWNSDMRYGLFGIQEEEYNELYEFPEVAVHSDKDISYDMEYSVFMEHYADELIEEQLNGQR
mgnify:CR=1 FL=1